MFNKKITEKKVELSISNFIDLKNKDDYAFYTFLNESLSKSWNDIA